LELIESACFIKLLSLGNEKDNSSKDIRSGKLDSVY